MPSKIQNAALNLRMSKQLLSDARAQATRKGMGVSEYVRHIIRRDLDAIEITPRAPTGKVAPFGTALVPNEAFPAALAKIVANAAAGDLESLRALFKDRLAALSGENKPHVLHAAAISAELITLGRLMVSHGHHLDMRDFAAALIHSSDAFEAAGDQGSATFLRTECIAVLDQLAEHGDDMAAFSIDRLSQRWSPDVISLARDLRKAAVAVEEAV